MGTKVHQDITPGAQAAAAIFNLPLGQLDDALTDLELQFGDYVISGGLPALPAGLVITQPATRAFIQGFRVVAGATSLTAVATSDNYIDLDTAGVYHVTAVANGAAAPPVFVNSARLYKLITSATAGLTLVDLRLQAALTTMGGAFINVKASPYLAKGDGVTDDTAAIQGALNAARLAGGGLVYLPLGVYMLSLSNHPIGGATFPVGLVMGSNTALWGATRDATVLRLLPTANQDQGSVLMNYSVSTGGDLNLLVRDLTIDGNAGNLSPVPTNRQMGIQFMRTRYASHERVRAINVYGTNTTNGEGFHFETTLGSDTTYIDCQAFGSAAGKTSSGFSADQATNVRYVACQAISMATGHGFTHNNCGGVRYESCEAYLNNQVGFNSEGGAQGGYDSTYVQCVSGGVASPGTGTLFPWTAGQSLGNQNGFFINTTKRVQLIGCTAENNANDGLKVVSGATGRVIGGIFQNNSNANLEWDTTATAQGWRCTNLEPQLGTGGFGMLINNALVNPFGVTTSPAVPASGTAQLNPYPFDAYVWITGGTVTGVSIGGNPVTIINPGMYPVAAGQTITLTYSAAPTWVWVLQ